MRPCPHCGCSILGVGWMADKHPMDRCSVICRTCGARGPEKTTEAEAKKAWSGKEFVCRVDTDRLSKHIKLCRKNLKSNRVVCCANCPFEAAVVHEDMDLYLLFEAKRKMLAKRPIKKA